VKPPSPTAARRRSRQLALQGLYEWSVSKSDRGAIEAHMREQPGYAQCDAEHFDALLRGCIEQAAVLDAALARHVDRKFSLLSPVELAALRIGAYELQSCVDIPYRVAINEAVELSKTFGGTDGHRFVNGVLDKVAGDLRPAEVGDRSIRTKAAAPRSAGRRGPDTGASS
jgi:N utilization substance protein B